MFNFRVPKRPRDDASDSEDERYTTKSRPWAIPQRPSPLAFWPSPAQPPAGPSLPPSPPRALPDLELATRATSEPSDTNSPASFQDSPIPFTSPPQLRPDTDSDGDHDMDTEMDDDTDFDLVGSPSLDAPALDTFHAPLRPAKLNSSLFGGSRDGDAVMHGSASGRIPTPMHPTFRLGGVGYPSGGMAGGLHTDSYTSSTRGPHLSVPSDPVRQNAVAYAENRSLRMPSPIREDEFSDFCDTPTAITQSQLSRLSVDEGMDLDASIEGDNGDHAEEMVPPPGANTTPTKGRKRSGALSAKGRFSMGYRDDCEKCRMRVPGHYSHFLP